MHERKLYQSFSIRVGVSKLPRPLYVEAIMNLEFQSKKSLKYLRQEVIPLLVLIEQWSKSGQSALIKTNEILMLLDVLHLTLTKTQQV